MSSRPLLFHFLALRLLVSLSVLILISGCGGSGREAATPIPVDIARPTQPTPQFPETVGAFTIAPSPDIRYAPTASEPDSLLPEGSGAQHPGLPFVQLPSALGITLRTAGIIDEPKGVQLRLLPPGTTVTITGKSADENYFALFTHDGDTGWIDAGLLRVYGGDDLLVVERPLGLGPVATLLADAMEPVSPGIIATLEAAK